MRRLSWILAAVILAVLALIHAELGAAYPVAGGTARFPRFAFGDLAGFAAGWTAWLQAVAIAPIEVEASLSYLNSIKWVGTHLNMLSADGTLTASGIGMLALASMFQDDGLLAAEAAATNPLAPKPSHFPGKAKRCICIFLEGAPSQIDLFDPKPKLNELDGQKLPESMTRNVRFAPVCLCHANSPA